MSNSAKREPKLFTSSTTSFSADTRLPITKNAAQPSGASARFVAGIYTSTTCPRCGHTVHHSFASTVNSNSGSPAPPPASSSSGITSSTVIAPAQETSGFSWQGLAPNSLGVVPCALESLDSPAFWPISCAFVLHAYVVDLVLDHDDVSHLSPSSPCVRVLDLDDPSFYPQLYPAQPLLFSPVEGKEAQPACHCPSQTLPFAVPWDSYPRSPLLRSLRPRRCILIHLLVVQPMGKPKMTWFVAKVTSLFLP